MQSICTGTQDEVDDSDVIDRPQAGEVSEVDSPSLANSKISRVGDPMNPDTPDGPDGSDLECRVPELGDGRSQAGT